jgi:hypothetical protein
VILGSLLERLSRLEHRERKRSAEQRPDS